MSILARLRGPRTMLAAAAGLRGRLAVVRTIAAGRRWKRRGGTPPEPAAVPMKAIGGSPVYVRPGTSDLINAAAYYSLSIHMPPPQLRGEDLRCICELGSNIGVALRALADAFPQATLLGVEPDGENIAMARTNLAGLEDRCELVQAAIWDEPVDFLVAEDVGRGAHGLTVRPGREGEAGHPGAMPAVTIDSLLDEHLPGRTVDYMHVSIEGSEPRVFAAGGRWPERVRSLRVELHPYYGYTAEQCLAQLQALGYAAWPDPELSTKWIYAVRDPAAASHSDT